MLLQESDKQLIEGCRRSETEAFRSLFERYKDRVYSIAFRFSGDHALAQDIAQETFLKVFIGLKSFRGESDFTSWLYRLVVNSCLDQKRRTSRLIPLLDKVAMMLPTPGLSTLDGCLRAELSGQVQAAVASLNDEQRILIVLRYTEGLSYCEIGEILGCPSGTIASRLNRIHKMLQRRLARVVPGECQR